MSISFDFLAAMRGIHGTLGPTITARLRERAPGRGNWTHTINHRTSATAIQWVGSFKPWGFVTRGTKAHPILPVRATVLRFETRDGSVVFARKVNHPGTQPNRFPMQVWRESLAEITPILKGGVRSGLVIKQVNPYRAQVL